MAQKKGMMQNRWQINFIRVTTPFCLFTCRTALILSHCLDESLSLCLGVLQMSGCLVIGTVGASFIFVISLSQFNSPREWSCSFPSLHGLLINPWLMRSLFMVIGEWEFNNVKCNCLYILRLHPLLVHFRLTAFWDLLDVRQAWALRCAWALRHGWDLRSTCALRHAWDCLDVRSGQITPVTCCRYHVNLN